MILKGRLYAKTQDLFLLKGEEIGKKSVYIRAANQWAGATGRIRDKMEEEGPWLSGWRKRRERERGRREGERRIDSKVTKRREMGGKRGTRKRATRFEPRKFDVRRGKRRIPLELEATSLPRDIEIRLK